MINRWCYLVEARIDAKIRQLERKFHASNSPEDLATLLLVTRDTDDYHIKKLVTQDPRPHVISPFAYEIRWGNSSRSNYGLVIWAISEWNKEPGTEHYSRLDSYPVSFRKSLSLKSHRHPETVALRAAKDFLELK